MTVSKALPADLIDSLLSDYKKPEDLIGENGLLKQLTKALVERALEAEMAEHLGHERNDPVANPSGNTRNGKSRKTLKGEFRMVIYTTNAIESVNMSLRKITKNRGSFPSDEALVKLFYLALNNISKKWGMPIRDCRSGTGKPL